MVKTYSETETDPETENDILTAITNQKDQLQKTKAKGSGTEKKGGNVTKRAIVSFFILAQYLIPVHMGAPFWILNQNFSSACMFDEFMRIGREHRKDTYTM
jgi:hypothetical protein